MRLLAVTEAIPQNSCAPMTTRSSSLPPVAPSASSRIWAGGTPVGRREGTVVGLDGEGEAEEQDEAGHPGRPDGLDDALRAGRRRVVRLLGHVGGGVVPGEGVLRHQQAQRTTYSPLPQPVLLTNSVNTNDADWWLVRDEGERADDDATPTTCHHTLMLLSRPTMRTPKVFSRPCSSRIPANSRIGPARGHLEAELEVQVGAEEGRRAEVDAGGHGDLAEHVEPAREPGPGRRVRAGASRWAQKYRPAEVG